MKKFLIISAIALATFSAFCAGTKKFGKMKDSDWVVTNAWQAMQHRVKPDSEWATNHFGSAEFSNAVGKVQRKVDIPVKSVNGKTGDVILNASDVHALPDTYTPPPETDPTVPAWAKQPNPPEGMTDNALVLTNGAVKTANGLKTIGAADVGAVAISKSPSSPVTFNWNPDGGNEIRLYEPSLKVGIGIGLFLRGFGGELRNYHEGEYDWYHFPPGESGVLALKSWRSLLDMLNISKSTDLAANHTFSNAVLSVGLNIDTDSVAVLNEIADTFGGFPLEGTATTVGGLLAALAAAIAWLKKNKVGSFASVGGASATVDNGVAKLDDFFTESNSLLNARITYERNATGLKDRAFNALTFDGTAYNLSTALAAVTPTASGQPRDLLIVATATAATTISFTAGTIKGDKPTIDGAGTWLITLTEYAANTWYCRQIKMEDAA